MLFTQILKVYKSQLRAAYTNIYIERQKIISPIERSLHWADEIQEIDASLNLTPDVLKIPADIIIPAEPKKIKKRIRATCVQVKKVEKARRATMADVERIAKRRKATFMLGGTITRHETRVAVEPKDALTTISNRKITEGLVTEIF